jgi:uncharacterized membrane protein
MFGGGLILQGVELPKKKELPLEEVVPIECLEREQPLQEATSF